MHPFLKATPSTMATGFDLTHYTEVSGFLDKSGQRKECAIIHDTRIFCDSESARDSVLAKLAKIAEFAEKEEEGTFSFFVLKSLDGDDRMRYASWEAFETHQDSKQLVELWLSSKEEIKSLEGRTYVPNMKGWLSRLS